MYRMFGAIVIFSDFSFLTCFDCINYDSIGVQMYRGNLLKIEKKNIQNDWS